MRRHPKLVAALSFAAASLIGIGNASAWTPNGVVATISSVTTWQDDSAGEVVIHTASGDVCHFYANGSNGKNLLSIVMAYYLASKPVRLYCHDATTNVGGFISHRLHRIGAP